MVSMGILSISSVWPKKSKILKIKFDYVDLPKNIIGKVDAWLVYIYSINYRVLGENTWVGGMIRITGG